ncbi:hypothetical protein QFZ79_002569 [Arthrobacter sp. V4I6]|uniref:hypothetical protein n=1 Tax=unclassified Arthrobacter TaxID=235627 RepID=UPI002783F2E3|nr:MULTISPECIES: hypothetical protein [unclassified Arthrobacter]MDQ0820276.1 hypothetical protein [Arthrobacter sp. V1I7]MDQ0854458.1 hypothetical protein [Arthrobacter sp. V4I6]
MDGNREPEVVRGGRGGAGSGATVPDVARLLATMRVSHLDDGGGAGAFGAEHDDGGAGCGGAGARAD